MVNPIFRSPSLKSYIRTGAIFALVVLAGLVAFSTFAQPSPKALSSFDPQVKPILAQMTLDEKIGQMTQPEQI